MMEQAGCTGSRGSTVTRNTRGNVVNYTEVRIAGHETSRSKISKYPLMPHEPWHRVAQTLPRAD